MKDKDKQNQIDKLTRIAAILESQSESLKIHNDLISQQVDIFRNTSILQGNDGEAVERLREIEEKKLRLSVEPKLWINGAGYKGATGELKIDLNNKGELANLLEFDLKSDDLILHNESLPHELEKGGRRYIFARANTKKPIKDCEYIIDVIYSDKLKNKYSTKISGKGANAKVVDNTEIQKKE